MNGWAAMMIGADAPRRALQLFEQVERIESEREAGAEPSATAVGNRVPSAGRRAFEKKVCIGR
jgi:hypothetical protein